MKNGSTKRLVLIVLFGLLLRLLYVVYLDSGFPISDSLDYDKRAMSLLDGRGYGDTFRPPLCPFFLAVVYWLFGHQYLAVKLIQSLFSAGTILLAYVLGKMLFDNHAALAGALIVAMYPSLIINCGQLLSETVYTAILTAMVLLVIIASRSKRRWLLRAAAGFLMGLGTLGKPVLLMFVPFWLVYETVSHKSLFIALRNLLPCILAALFAIAPWIAYNFARYDRFIYIDTNGGFNFWVGNNPQSTGKMEEYAVAAYFEFSDDFERQRELYKRALRFIRDNPIHFLRLFIAKVRIFTGIEGRQFSHLYVTNYYGKIPTLSLFIMLSAIVISFPLLAIFFLIGLFMLPRMEYGLGLMLTLLGYYILIHALSVTEARYHFPVVPLLATLAGYGMIKTKELHIAMKKSSKAKLLAIVSILGILLISWSLQIIAFIPRAQTMLAPLGNVSFLPY